MVKFEFENIRFIDKKDIVRFMFMKYFFFDVLKSELEKISPLKITKHALEFKANEDKAQHKMNRILQKGFNNLQNIITKKPATYVHLKSGIPLVGNNSFGIIDRNTNILEIKPITGCNLDCIFCSVPDRKRYSDFIVEEEYMIQELKKIIDYKGCDDIEIHIGVQGEPLLYSDLVRLVSDAKAISGVKRITMNTNATFLTKELAKDLIHAGMTRINISINSMDTEASKRIASADYNLKHIKSMIAYLAKHYPNNIHIAPVVMFGKNDKDMEDLVKFAKENSINCWIQNFLEYKGGNRPVKQKDWEYFKDFLKKLEEKYDFKLLVDFKTDFKLSETRSLPSIFKKGDVIMAEVLCMGRLRHEFIVKCNDRTISVINDKAKKASPGDIVKIKITNLKHNMAKAILVG